MVCFVFQAWSKTSPLARQQVMFKYQALIKENLKEIAKLITFEQGKTIPDAEGDVMRGLQVNVVIVVVVIVKINITVL